MAMSEGDTRSGLQVPLQCDRPSFVRKPDDAVDHPWAKAVRVSTAASIVNLQPRAQIVRQPDVIARWLLVVSQNVDGPFRIHSGDRSKRSTMRDVSGTGGNQVTAVAAIEESANDSGAG